MVQGKFGFVEAKTARRLADLVGVEFGQRHVEGGVGLPVAALLGEGGQQRPGVELGTDEAAGAAAAPRSA
ncbi:hypothetical protein GCM10010307_81760 [Streptomyces vastus]|uniref:Uncharacterized protein n=1 Tax=Streptomyces vastus TaxID=285451 RepID=A0ABN3RWM1_9ACTN